MGWRPRNLTWKVIFSLTAWLDRLRMLDFAGPTDDDSELETPLQIPLSWTVASEQMP
jgi:hypothetical protein